MVLAKRFGSRLELLIGEFQDLHPAYFDPMTATLQEFHDAIMAGHRAMLERYVQAGGARRASMRSARRCGARRSTRSCSHASPRPGRTSS